MKATQLILKKNQILMKILGRLRLIEYLGDNEIDHSFYLLN